MTYKREKWNCNDLFSTFGWNGWCQWSVWLDVVNNFFNVLQSMARQEQPLQEGEVKQDCCFERLSL